MTRALGPEAVISGVAETPYVRHATGLTTAGVLAGAAIAAVKDAGLSWSDIDGLAVSSFSLSPDHCIDLAWRLGLKLTWVADFFTGGASGVDMVRAAARAVDAGDANAVLVLAGDHFGDGAFTDMTADFNIATRDLLAPLPYGGPNSLFAMVTDRHMRRYGLEREDYGHVVMAQRAWAAKNPAATYRAELTVEEYLAAPMVASPLTHFDCPPVVSGADAVVVSGRTRPGRSPHVRIRSIAASFNRDDQEGDGLTTGLADIVGNGFWDHAELDARDCDVISVYDDYPVMVLAQLQDLGLVAEGEVAAFTRGTLAAGGYPLNTSGGQLCAGQAGAGGGLHGVVEVVRQLRDDCGPRQVDGARLGLVTGYGMVLYRHGACATAAVLEAQR
jgi:acetyl-CoA acetyltransferase